MDGLRRTFTDDEVQETIQTAIDITAKLKCPDDLRVSAFAATLNMVGNMQAERGILAVPEMRVDSRKLQ